MAYAQAPTGQTIVPTGYGPRVAPTGQTTAPTGYGPRVAPAQQPPSTQLNLHFKERGINVEVQNKIQPINPSRKPWARPMQTEGALPLSFLNNQTRENGDVGFTNQGGAHLAADHSRFRRYLGSPDVPLKQRIRGKVSSEDQKERRQFCETTLQEENTRRKSMRLPPLSLNHLRIQLRYDIGRTPTDLPGIPISNHPPQRGTGSSQPAGISEIHHPVQQGAIASKWMTVEEYANSTEVNTSQTKKIRDNTGKTQKRTYTARANFGIPQGNGQVVEFNTIAPGPPTQHPQPGMVAPGPPTNAFNPFTPRVPFLSSLALEQAQAIAANTNAHQDLQQNYPHYDICHLASEEVKMHFEPVEQGFKVMKGFESKFIPFNSSLGISPSDPYWQQNLGNHISAKGGFDALPKQDFSSPQVASAAPGSSPAKVPPTFKAPGTTGSPVPPTLRDPAHGATNFGPRVTGQGQRPWR